MFISRGKGKNGTVLSFFQACFLAGNVVVANGKQLREGKLSCCVHQKDKVETLSTDGTAFSY